MVLYTVNGNITYTDLNDKEYGITLEGRITNIINKQEKVIYVNEDNFEKLILLFQSDGLFYSYQVEA